MQAYFRYKFAAFYFKSFSLNHKRIHSSDIKAIFEEKKVKMAIKLFVVLSAVFAVSMASPTVSGDYGSVGVQTDQTIRVSFLKLLIFSLLIESFYLHFLREL